MSNQFKKPTKEEIEKKLTKLQIEVTQNEGTERPFENEYNANKAAGLYVDIVSGEPLFTSNEKYDSGSGWPSFYKPISDETVTTKECRRGSSLRVEVRSKIADSHLGHVFTDGPQPTGLRYCMNSASMRFVPVDRLEAEGYADFLPLFKDKK